MSLRSTLLKEIDSTIEKFISIIASKYNLDKNEIELLWNKGDNTNVCNITKNVKDEPISTPNKKDFNISELSKFNKTELISMCKTHGHKCSGTKDALINRLLGQVETEEKKSEITVTKPSKKVDEKIKQTPVVKKITSDIPSVLIRRNKFNNYEHPESSFIFDNDTKTIIGKQKSDGSIEELSHEDIEKCKYLYNFKYKLPSNLDSKSLADVKIDELSDDEDLQVEEDEESKVDEEVVEEDFLEQELEEEDFLEEEQEEELEEDD